MNSAFAYAFSIAIFSTTEGEETVINKHCGHVLAFMRLLTSKGGDLLSNLIKLMNLKTESRFFTKPDTYW